MLTPEAHEIRAMYARRVATSPRPRVQLCRLTRKWVVTYDGRRHDCGVRPYRDEAFGAWYRAMAAANTHARATRLRVFDQLCQMNGGDWWWES